MKKILLSITALTFGATVAFAQTEIETPETQQETQSEEIAVERLTSESEAGKRKIEMTELPASVQEAFQNSEFKDWEVAEIYEVGAAITEDATVDPSTTTPEDAAQGIATSEASYEILVISKDMKDEIEDTQETIQEETEEILEEGEAAEVSTETVKVEIPAVVLKYDNQGQLLEQKEQKSETENEQY